MSASVLVAPDSFKGSFDAVSVAEAIATGLGRAGIGVDRCPVADGGEGTAAIMAAARGGELREVAATDPLGRPIDAEYALLADGLTAVVDVAAASGLTLVAEEQRDPLAASSCGTGELVRSAVAAGAQRVLVAAGGSAMTDGGLGAIEAIGDPENLRGVELIVLADVNTPFERAAAVFGPQKGADTTTVNALTARLIACARALPRDPRGVPGTGAAGGLAGGLWATYGASIVAGAAYVLEVLEFDRRLASAAAVITGEGRLDAQSLEGKIVGEILRRASRQGVPCHAIVGGEMLASADRERFAPGEVLEAQTLATIAKAAQQLGLAVSRCCHGRHQVTAVRVLGPIEEQAQRGRNNRDTF